MGQADTSWETTLAAVTRDQYLPKLQDNVFDSSATLYSIKEKSQVLIKDGGIYIQVPILVGENTTTDSYTGYDVVDTSPQKGMIDGIIAKAYYSTAITISNQEQKENKGESKVIDLMASKIMQAEKSSIDRINQDLYLAGTGNGGKDITGLLAMIPSTSAITTAYMGLTSIANWKHNYDEGATATLIAALRTMYYGTGDGMDKPDLITTDEHGMEDYETAALSTSTVLNYQSNKLADAGFMSLSFKGIPIIQDNGAPFGGTYSQFHMLTTKYLGFFYEQEMTDFVRPANQNAKVALLNQTCQLVTNNRRRQAKLVLTS